MTANASAVPPLAFSISSLSSEASSENIPFFEGFSDSAFSPLASPDEEKAEPPGIDEFLASLCPGESTEAGVFAGVAVSSSQQWPTQSSESADYNFELFGPPPSAAGAQNAELRFTELMMKMREVGFVDMESMILEYYSTQFRRESLPYWLQRRSRQQNLCKLLDQLYSRSNSWPSDESASFQKGIREIAQRVSNTAPSTFDALSTFHFPIGNGPS